jgi:hypothetical protein
VLSGFPLPSEVAIVSYHCSTIFIRSSFPCWPLVVGVLGGSFRRDSLMEHKGGVSKLGGSPPLSTPVLVSGEWGTRGRRRRMDCGLLVVTAPRLLLASLPAILSQADVPDSCQLT